MPKVSISSPSQLLPFCSLRELDKMLDITSILLIVGLAISPIIATPMPQSSPNDPGFGICPDGGRCRLGSDDCGQGYPCAALRKRPSSLPGICASNQQCTVDSDCADRSPCAILSDRKHTGAVHVDNRELEQNVHPPTTSDF